MKASWVTAGIAAAIIAPGLAACGGGSGGSGGASPAKSPQAAPKPAPIGANGYTPKGSHLTVGQAATLGWNPPFEKGKRPPLKLEVTVKSIEKAPLADYKHAHDMDAKDKKATPYYVTVQIKALTNRGYKSDFTPDDGFRGLDDGGDYLVAHSFFGQTGACAKPVTVPKPFVTGKSFTTCLPYLVPAGHAFKGPVWTDGPVPKGEIVTPYLGHPVLWSGS
jgi:hypothetical protein